MGCSGKGIPVSHYASGTGAAVASGDSISTAIGLSILGSGGNAADAAAAVILSLTVTDSKDLCFGGEASALIYDPGIMKVQEISAVGRAPVSLSAVQWYMENGIPVNDIRSAPVPAIPGLIVTLLEKYGTKSFSEIARPTLNLLETGNEPWHPALLSTLKKLIEAENNFPDDRRKGLDAVNRRFYQGDIADSLASWYSRSGGFLSKADLADHRTVIDEPISISFQGYTIYKCGPWTQGPVLLEAMNILGSKIGADNILTGQKSKSELIHIAAEAMKLAMADRDEYFGDPEFVDVPLDALMSEKYASLRATLIDTGKVMTRAVTGDPHGMKAEKSIHPFTTWQGGTTTCCVRDAGGMMIAATPSGWGSNAGPGGSTGIWHSTRLRSLNTSPGHPNCIAPGKRPRITLTPTIIIKNDRPFAAIAVAGGDVQDQVTYNILINLLLMDMGSNESVQSPRYVINLHQDSFNPSAGRALAIPDEITLTLSSNMPQNIIQLLENKGHLVRKQDLIGEPVLITVRGSGGFAEAVTDQLTNHYAGILND